MIVCDTNILSTFARVDALDLLFKLFPKHEFAVPPAVYGEVKQARGFVFVAAVLKLIDSGPIRFWCSPLKKWSQKRACPNHLARANQTPWQSAFGVMPFS